ncbi:MAG TPA: hypothetical protein VIM11_19385 [Tepidisphaeraceae bacterium]
MRRNKVKVFTVVIVAALLANLAGLLDPSYWNDPGGNHRARNGPSQGQLTEVATQTLPPAEVAAGGAWNTENTERRSNRESLLAAIIRFFRDNPGNE